MPPEDVVVSLPPFEVRTDPDDVRAFRNALGLGPETLAGAVPLTFPIRWLASPEVQGRLRKVADDENVLLVHEAQSFHYARRLQTGRAYRLEVELRRDGGRAERAVVSGRVVDSDGSVLGVVETVLRLVEAPEAAEP